MGDVNDESTHNDERMADLLAELREPPRHWVEAAQQLPQARRSLDEIVGRGRRRLP
jgi:hypothetical protein